jgi:integrator complex subunit 7
LKLALRLQQWSREPPASPVIARLYNLDIGQESAFLNAIMMHLTEAFRTGDNFVRLCVLKILLQEKKSRRSGVQDLQGKGLITKERIPNHAEVLKRLKTIIKSGDHTAKALALLVTGCLAELAKDSIDVHRLVFEAIHSPYECEVSLLVVPAYSF